MPRRYSTREIERALRSIGFVLVRQRGSHLRYVGQIGGVTRNVTLVANQRTIQASTLALIRQQIGLSRQAFEYLIDHRELPDEDVR